MITPSIYGLKYGLKYFKITDWNQILMKYVIKKYTISCLNIRIIKINVINVFYETNDNSHRGRNLLSR